MKTYTLKNLKDKNIVIITQQGTTGPAHDLKDYLQKRTNKLLFIGHPLLFLPKYRESVSEWKLFVHGRKINEGTAMQWRGPELVLYIKDFIYSLVWFFQKIKKADVFIGVGNINAFLGIILKKIGFVSCVVFYCIDYVPLRFSNPLINSIYHAIDKFVVSQSDSTWNLSPRMAEGREKKWNRKFSKQYTVPLGIWFDRIRMNLKSHTFNKNEIIYLGTILESHGLDICIDAIERLSKKISDIKLVIIGEGPYKNKLLEKVKRRHLEKYVEFLGYVSSHAEVERRIAKSSLAVALYNPRIDKFTFYADPGKVKNYLGCGVPVLITNVPFVATQVKKYNCGVVVDYNLRAVTDAIKNYFLDQRQTKEYKKNALEFAKQFDWNNVFSNAFSQTYIS